MPKKIRQVQVWSDNAHWVVHMGSLTPVRRTAPSTPSMLAAFGEKIPYAALAAIERALGTAQLTKQGIYIAHDSMGTPRYIGRGHIFPRLRQRRRKFRHELVYFSFYVVKDKVHERELETLLIRAAGPSLEFNTQKKRVGIRPGRVKDFAEGNVYFERTHFTSKRPSRRARP